MLEAKSFSEEKVLSVRHWTDFLFSFSLTRPAGFKFRPGEFTMLGLPAEAGGKPVLRAYSMASPSWEEHLEFLSIKVPNGPLTSRLQKIKEGDTVLLGRKPSGTLVHDALQPGKKLFLFGTGTGLAPWLSIVRDLDTYERFEQIIVCHGVRHIAELCYRDFLEKEIFEHEHLGDLVRGRLKYYPTVTREAFTRQGRLTDHIRTGRLFQELGFAQTRFNPESDRVMICGSSDVNRSLIEICEEHGLTEGANSHPGLYVVEKAFVDAKPQENKPAIEALRGFG